MNEREVKKVVLATLLEWCGVEEKDIDADGLVRAVENRIAEDLSREDREATSRDKAKTRSREARQARVHETRSPN